MNIEAIDFLNQLNEYGKIDYADYSHLHDLLTSEEPEWEYGRTPELGYAVTVLSNTPGNIEYQREHGYEIVRRRKAGSWEPVRN